MDLTIVRVNFGLSNKIYNFKTGEEYERAR